MAFFAELQRRRVGKVAIAYGAIAWAATEASSVVLPALHVPEWVLTAIVVFLLVGFPIAMALAWIFDVGPEGISRTEPQAPPAAQVKLRVAYAAVVIVCMGALGYVLYERGLGRAHAGEPRDSIAVMPFANLSGDPSRDYFSDGMSEELLNLLARVPGLQVASRTSSFAYKDRDVDVRQIGKELGVSTVLEGSVRQASDRVRITAQLIDAQSGFHLWSETYDRKLADVFQVQDEIAKAIVDKLRIELAPADQQLAQRQKAPTQNVEAYELYLQGRAIWKRRGAENLKRAIELYQAAIGKDPAFARAHAALASAYVVLPGYTKDSGRRGEIPPAGRRCGAPGAGDRSVHRRGARGAGADQRQSWRPAGRRIRVLLRDFTRAERADAAPVVFDTAGESRQAHGQPRAGADSPGARPDLADPCGQPRECLPAERRRRRSAALREAGLRAGTRGRHEPRRRNGGCDTARPVGPGATPAGRARGALAGAAGQGAAVRRCAGRSGEASEDRC